MIYTIHISEEAEADLRGIYEYIAFEKMSPENAEGQLNRLEEKILELENFPEKYKRYNREPWYSRGTRIMPVDNYVVYYIPNEKTAMIDIIRVLYSGQDRESKMDTMASLEK